LVQTVRLLAQSDSVGQRRCGKGFKEKQKAKRSKAGINSEYSQGREISLKMGGGGGGGAGMGVPRLLQTGKDVKRQVKQGKRFLVGKRKGAEEKISN